MTIMDKLTNIVNIEVAQYLSFFTVPAWVAMTILPIVFKTIAIAVLMSVFLDINVFRRPGSSF